MRTFIRYTALALLGLCAVAALALSLSSPLLYSLQQDVFPSQFHENSDVLKTQVINSTTDVLPLMQDLLDYSGPIVVNVRTGNVEQARRDLEFFAQNRRSLNNLVVKLDMTESEMQEFSKSKANQEKILRELVNSSVSLDQLTSLEIQYRDQNNPTMQMSMKLQGDTLRKKIQTLSDQYRQESATASAIGRKAGLETTSEEQSVQELDQYVKAIGQSEKQIDIPLRRTSQMSLLIYPDSVTYGDTFKCFGYYFSQYGYRVASTPNKTVTLYIDTTSAGNTMTDDTGSYSLIVPVERIPAGTHRIHVESGTTHSESRSLTVHAVDSVTTLKVRRTKNAGEVVCSGTVVANLPVRNAPVELVWDGSNVSRTSTNIRGEFSSQLNLTAGMHSVQARFSGDGFPVNPSESSVQTIMVTTPGISDNRFLFYAGVFCLLSLFIVGAVYYIRRTPGQSIFSIPRALRVPAPDETDPGSDDGTGMVPEVSVTENRPDEVTLIQRYSGLIRTAGLSEASYAVYCDLAGRIARDLRISRYRVLTPREMSGSCRERPYCGAFSHLVSAYERIRYGGYHSSPVQEEFEGSMQTVDAQLGGEDH